MLTALRLVARLFSLSLPSRLLRQHRSRRALFLPTLRTPHPLRHILEPSIPAAQSTERFRLGSPLMAARRAFENQRALTELIAEFLDMKSTRHAANCCDSSWSRPSSIDRTVTLYVGLADINHALSEVWGRLDVGRRRAKHGLGACAERVRQGRRTLACSDAGTAQASQVCDESTPRYQHNSDPYRAHRNVLFRREWCARNHNWLFLIGKTVLRMETAYSGSFIGFFLLARSGA